MTVTRRRALHLTASAMVSAGLPGTVFASRRTGVDSVGRAVAVPEAISRIFPAGPPAAIFLYMVAPDLLAGWPRALYPDERETIAPGYRDLPVVGRLTGRGGSANLETVLAMQPDVILDYGSLRPTYVSLADRVQQQTGIPYALIDGRFDQIAAAFRAVGALIGRPERGDACAVEAERIVAELQAARHLVSDRPAPRVYYGRSADGLQTGLAGSINSELLAHAGAVNVAESAGEGGLTTVSLEQVVTWDPDVILTTEPNFYALIWQHPVWRNLRAVGAGRVYLSPTLPFGWFDRPPSANRLIGLHWLLSVLYPDRFGDRLAAETRRFYRLFYHLDLDDALLAQIMVAGSLPGTGRSQ